jgi:hypothetical protein
MKNLKIQLPILAALLLVNAGFYFTGGCGSLDKTGVYQGDKFLYSSDLALATSYDAIHGFVSWEYQQRQAGLALPPEITKAADDIRAQAPAAFASAFSLRDAYTANPTDANRTAFQTGLNVIHAMLAVANRYYVLSSVKTLSTPGK